MGSIFLFHKISQGQRLPPDKYILRFHFDPPEISDNRDTEWTATNAQAAIPSLSFDHTGLRVLKFTARFNDFAPGVTPVVIGGYLSTQKSIEWIRLRQQQNLPAWDEPPTLIFTGAKSENGSSLYFEGVISSSDIVSKVIAGPEVMARPSLLAFTDTKLNDVIRAEVAITMQEKLDPAQGPATSISQAFDQGVRESARGAGQ